MNKEEFLNELKNGLTGLPQDDVDERIAFYGEMIDDRIEEGLNESEAVAGIGTVDDIVAQTVADIPITKVIKEKIKPKRALRTTEIVLLVLGFPLWFPLLIAVGAILLSVYVIIWSLIISLWAIEISLWAGAVGGIASAIANAIAGNTIPVAAMIGTGLFCAGLAGFAFFGCVAGSKIIIRYTKKTTLGVKTRLIGKEIKK